MMFQSHLVPVLPLRIHMSVLAFCQFLKIFRNTLSFQLNADQSKYTHTQQGILVLYLEKINQEMAVQIQR